MCYLFLLVLELLVIFNEFCLGVNILIGVWSKTLATQATLEGHEANIHGHPLPCCLLKLRIFSAIYTILFGFSSSGILFLIMAFLSLFQLFFTFT